ncbi:unnamed protein product [Rotaria socialis]|uniref:RRM domain-containing protein n=2 Tax=Rotaria socialis TaxID=392032 RepID=A0A818RLF7_9BILA|nr:unnamed protein product [Rotaria socialis]CAF3652639.1 unnamed protein product [Rotaria socialis]
MSESHRDYNKSPNTLPSNNYRNSNNETERYNRKRSHLEMENIDAKVYVGNVSTEKVSDEELLNFFKPFGKIADIRVFKDHIYVQYNRVDDAKKLIEEAQMPLILKGKKLNILPARYMRSKSSKSSSTDRSSKKSHERTFHQHSSNYEISRKRFSTRARSNFNSNINGIESDIHDRMNISLSSSDLCRTSNDSTSRNHQLPYTVLTEPKNQNDLVDCQIIIVNNRQRAYAEEIESRFCSHGLLTSVILLREDYTLIEAIANAARLQCLYGVIAMPMHEERRTASFHILYGQTEEHRNLTLDDGIHIIITNFISYKERLHNEEMNSYNENNDSIVYSETNVPYEYSHPSNDTIQENLSPPMLTLGDRLPLSMLLCLLADGRQLTLEEIDRVLVYLLEKKAKMLTLPAGTLPPLPAQYATINAFNHQTGSGIVSDTRSVSVSDLSFGKSSSSSMDVSSSIAEQIRQILSTNIVKSNIATVETNSQSVMTKTSSDKLLNIVKVENTNILQSNSNVTDAAKEYVQQQQQKTQSSFSRPKVEAVPVVSSVFNYASPSVTTTGSLTSFAAPNFSSYNSISSSLPFNSALKETSSVTAPNFVSQPSQYFYPMSSHTLYQSPLNATVTDPTVGMFQAYSQFNVHPTPNPSIANQQMAAQQQQQQIRK